MAFDAGEIKGRMAIDKSQWDKSTKDINKTQGTMAGMAKKTGSAYKNMAAGIAVGVAAFYAISKALKGAIRWMGDAVDKAAAQQLAEKEVASALESTGREVVKNTEHFKEYASKLQKATTFGDEQVLSAQALLIQLTKLDRDGLDAATKGAVGLASVYKQDLQAATTLVGKALAGNFGALSRYGIVVDRTATKEEKRAQLLEQLLVMYQRAEAEVDTHTGAMAQLANVYGDIKEEIGKVVTENEDFRDTLVLITEASSDLIESGILKWFTDIAVQAVRSVPMLNSLRESLASMALILKIQAEEQRRGSESMKEWMKHLALTDDLQKKLTKDVAEHIALLPEATKETETLTEKQRVLGRVAGWVARTELAAMNEELEKLIDNMRWARGDADVLQYEWDASMSSMEENTLAFTTNLINSLGGWAPAVEGASTNFETASEHIKLTTADMAAAVGATFTALAGENQALAIFGAIISTYAGAAKSLEQFGMPFAIPFIAMAIAAGLKQVAAIKKQAVPSAEEGAYLPHPTLIEAGHGAKGEVILPLDKAPIGGGVGAKVNFNFYAPIISTTGIASNDLDRVSEELFRKMEDQAKRRGYSLGGGAR